MATAQTGVFSATSYRVYMAVGGDRDLLTERPGYARDYLPIPARAFIASTAGTLVLVDLSGTESTIQAAANVIYPLQALTLRGGSTAGGVLVMW